MSVKTSFFPFNKGEDHVAPAIQRDPSLLRASENYEIGVSGGFRRIDGYERIDGRSKASVASYVILNFTASTGFVVGDIVTGAAATGEVLAVVITSGTFIAGDAAGYIAVSEIAGAYVAGEALKVTVVTKGTLVDAIAAGASNDALHQTYTRAAIDLARTKIHAVPGSGIIRGVWLYRGVRYAFRDNAAGTACVMWKATTAGWVAVTTPALLAGGRYVFVNANFGGATPSFNMFGCDGVNKGFQFDGTTFTQITTGMTLDAPQHIAEHKKHLFFSFGASVQHSSIGNPLVWAPISGAGEIALGDTVTGFMQLQGNAMAIFSRNSTHVLQGTSSADWNLTPYSRTTGAVEHSIQRLSDTFYLDDMGITHLKATQAFGNFAASTLTQGIQAWLSVQKVKLLASIAVRDKNQFRLFFNDGYCLTVKFAGNASGPTGYAQTGMQAVGMTRSLFPVAVQCTCSGEDTNGTEVLLFGDADGFVHELDSGTSFDGAAVAAFIRLPFYHYGSPSQRKRFRKIIMEVEASNATQILFQPEFSYGENIDVSAHITMTGNGGFWDIAQWGTFNWSGQPVETAVASINGTGVNMGLLIYSTGTYQQPHILQGMTVHYSMRRQER